MATMTPTGNQQPGILLQWNHGSVPNEEDGFFIIRFNILPAAVVGTEARVWIEAGTGQNTGPGGPGGTSRPVPITRGDAIVEIVDLNPRPMIFDANVAGGNPRLQPVTAFAGQSVQWGTMRTDPRVVIPSHPNRYGFLGWSRLADNNPAGIIADTIIWTVAEAEANPVVFAVWDGIPNGGVDVPMTFRGNGADDQEVIATIRTGVTFGTLSTRPVVLEPPAHPQNFRFLGWSFDQHAPAPDGGTGAAAIIPASQSWESAPLPGSRYRTVWAVWCTTSIPILPPYITFAFDSNGGQNPTVQAIIAELQPNNVNYVIPATGRPVQPTREHFTFAGWWTTPETGGESLEAVETRGITFHDPWPRTFYARWTPVGTNFAMTFVGNGGIPALQPVVAFVGPGIQWSTLITTTTPGLMNPTQHPDGYAFLGWSLRNDNDRTGIIPDTTVWTLTSPSTVYAVWGDQCTGVPMNMTFMGAGGDPNEQNITVTIFPHTVFGDFGRPPMIEEPDRRPNWTFGGWALRPAAPESEWIAPNTPWNLHSGNRVYAQWIFGYIPRLPTPITVAFVGNNGTPSHQAILADLVPSTTNYYLRSQPTNPTRQHNNFGGWFSACGVEYVPNTGQVVGYRGPHIFYARWNPIGENVAMTFDGNGGQPAIQAVVAFVGPGVLFGEMVADGTTPMVVNPQHPERFRFLGWSRSADNDPLGIIDPTTVWDVAQATANPVLFAVWCTERGPYPTPMNFLGNGGTPTDQAIEALIEFTSTFGDVLRNSNPAVVDPTRPGHTFIGWSREAAAGSPIIPDSAPWGAALTNTAYRTVHAQWRAEPPVYPPYIAFTFSGNGGAPAHQSILANRVGAGPNYTLSSQPTNPTRLHYNFLGWYTADGVAFADFTVTNPLTFYNPAQPRVFYARWEADTEEMAMWFVGNGGRPVDQIVVAHVGDGVTFGTLQTDPRVVDPFRDDYVFIGWSLTPDGAVIDPNTVWNNQSPSIVYARWTPGQRPPTVIMTFMGNGAPNQVVTATVTGTETFGTLNTDPVVQIPDHPNNYRFLGWSRTQPAGSAIIPDNAPWNLLNTSYHIVWAQWAPGPPDRDDYIPIAFHAPDSNIPRQVRLAAYPGTFFVALDEAPNDPYRHGFTFRGWYTEPVGGVRLAAGRPVGYRERNFYAQWDSNAHPMWFVGNGGYPADQVVTVLLGTASTFGNLNPSPRVVNPVHPEEYLFLGWATSPTGPVIDPNTPWNDTMAQVVYARWDTTRRDPRQLLEMTFVHNNMTTDEQEVEAWVGPGTTFGNLDTNPVVVRPTHPSGYRFLGWSLTRTGVVIADNTPWNPWSATRVYARWDSDQDEIYPDEISIAFYGAGGNPQRQLVLADLHDTATFFDSLQSVVQTPIHPDALDFLGWWTEMGGNGTELRAGDPITYGGARIFFADWESFFLEFRFDGDNSNPNPRPFDYIRIPVTPGEPVDWTTVDGAYVRAIGDILTTGSWGTNDLVEGHSFWGWFDNIVRRADGRDRPAVGSEGWDLGASNFTFTEAQFETLGDGMVISFTAIYSLWGDADDNDVVDPDDVLLMNRWLFDDAFGHPYFGSPINLRAANVTVSNPPGERINPDDALRLNRWLFDVAFGHPYFNAVLGRP